MSICEKLTGNSKELDFWVYVELDSNCSDFDLGVYLQVRLECEIKVPKHGEIEQDDIEFTDIRLLFTADEYHDLRPEDPLHYAISNSDQLKEYVFSEVYSDIQDFLANELEAEKASREDYEYDQWKDRQLEARA